MHDGHDSVTGQCALSYLRYRHLLWPDIQSILYFLNKYNSIYFSSMLLLLYETGSSNAATKTINMKLEWQQQETDAVYLLFEALRSENQITD